MPRLIADLAEAEEARLAEEARQQRAKEEASRVAAALESKRAEEARYAQANAAQLKRQEFERLARLEADAEVSAMGREPSGEAGGLGCIVWAIASLLITSVGATALRMMAPPRCNFERLSDECTQHPIILLTLLVFVLGTVSFWGAPFFVGVLQKRKQERYRQRRDEVYDRMNDRIRAYRPRN